MSQKTVLLVDDEQGFLEALADALKHEGHRVLTASTAEAALEILSHERVNLATVDIMLPPGASLDSKTTSHEAGIFLCERIRTEHPKLHVFCLSVVSDIGIIRRIERMGVRFLRKGETPLRTVLNMIRSKLTGVAYSTERRSQDPRE